MLPKTLALIEDDKIYSEALSSFLREQGVHVDVYSDSNDLLTQTQPYDYDFYVVDLMLPGIDGEDLVKVLRRRSDAGILVITARGDDDDVFEQVLGAGADMLLNKPASLKQAIAAIRAVHRRASKATQPASEWVLDKRAGKLVAPDGSRVELSETDIAVLQCFVEAQGETVSRDTLRQRLGKTADQDAEDGLNATMYRLRRRVERATPHLFPLQSKSRVGYQFRGTLKQV
ncbi:MAG: response regulator transcription factor [Burkholderiaceae bacterium]